MKCLWLLECEGNALIRATGEVFLIIQRVLHLEMYTQGTDNTPGCDIC